MYTFESRFVFRKISTVSISRSAPKMNNQIVVPRRHGAVRFLFWWLFLHRRLRPRQRGSTSCDMSGVAPVWLIISKGRYSFLSEQLSKMSCDIFKQAFRLRFRTFETVAFRSCRLRTHASPHMFHLPVPVKMPVSNLDCDAILHPEKTMSSIKYFKFRPYFIGVLWKSCGKPCGKIVDICVENPATFLASQVKNFVTFSGFENCL